MSNTNYQNVLFVYFMAHGKLIKISVFILNFISERKILITINFELFQF